ncbi:MAG: hypothetical protein ACYC6L_04575 [Anaerolineae bacterium]
MLRALTLVLIVILLAGCVPVSRVVATLPPNEPVEGSITPGGDSTPAPTSAPDSHSYAPQLGDDQLTRGNVFIDKTEIFLLKSNPPLFRLKIEGSLPTPCHSLRVVVPPADAKLRIAVEVYSLVSPGKSCAQVLKPFSATVSLDGSPAGQYTVLVNGQEVGQIVVPETGETSMKGWELYSWQENGVFQYALLPGTNRIKTSDEISAPGVRLADIEAVKRRLTGLAAGQTIMWNVLDYGGGQLPPQDVRDDLAAWCREHNLELIIASAL